MTVEIIKNGGIGVISVAAQALPKEFNLNVIQRKSNIKFNVFFDLIFREGNPSGIKSALEILGLSNNKVRLPLTKISENTYKEIQDFIKNIKKQ